MDIIKYTYRRDESKLENIDANDIDSIALHHMDHSTASIDEVCDWHMDENGWNFIGYGYWIGFDGKVYECRGYKFLNAAVAKNNNHIVSIGFQGNYNEDVPMPEAQFDAGFELIIYLKTILPNLKIIAGHNYWNKTSCPGKYFPLESMIKGAEALFNDENQIADYAKESVRKLYELGIIKGDTDGNFRPLDFITRQDLAVVINNLLNYLSEAEKK